MSFAGPAVSTVCVQGIAPGRFCLTRVAARRGAQVDGRPCCYGFWAPSGAKAVPGVSGARKKTEGLATLSGFIVCDGGMNKTNDHVGRNLDESLVILDDEMVCNAAPGAIALMNQIEAVSLGRTRFARRSGGLTARLAGHITKNALAPGRRGRLGG